MIAALCICAAAALIFGPGVKDWLLSLRPTSGRGSPPKKPSPKKPKKASNV